MKCGSCRYWKMGIPIGVCLHEKGSYQYTSDKMVFEDASDECPLVKELNEKYKKAELIEI